MSSVRQNYTKSEVFSQFSPFSVTNDTKSEVFSHFEAFFFAYLRIRKCPEKENGLVNWGNVNFPNSCKNATGQKGGKERSKVTENLRFRVVGFLIFPILTENFRFCAVGLEKEQTTQEKEGGFLNRRVRRGLSEENRLKGIARKEGRLKRAAWKASANEKIAVLGRCG